MDMDVCSDAEEYCLPEVFHAECAVGEVVVMERARFGRMELGRCVTRNYGYIGCSVDVLATLDDACSGHRACDLSVSDPALVRTKPCPKDFAAYLDADYRCVPGKTSPRGTSIVVVRDYSDLGKIRQHCIFSAFEHFSATVLFDYNK